jgi:hypothetical protein
MAGIQDILGYQNPYQPSSSAQARPQVQGPSRPGQVLGASTAMPSSTAGQQYSSPIGPVNQNAGMARINALTGGSSVGGGQPGGGVTSGILSGQYDQAQPQQPSLDFDAMIAPALQALDEAVNPAQEQYQGTLGQIEAGRVRGQTQTQSALDQAIAAANLQKTQNAQNTEGAVNEQRRGLSEVSKGLQARYGGTTGTGAFATELAGAKTLGNIAQIRQNFTNAATGIENKLQEVRQTATLALQDFEDQANNQKLAAKNQLDQTLNQIRLAKGELQGRKAEMASQAVQFYQQQLAQVNAANAQFKQNFALQLASAEQKLNSAKTSIAEKAAALKIFNTADKNTVIFNPKTGDYSPVDTSGQGSNQGQFFGGQTEEDPNDPYAGFING